MDRQTLASLCVASLLGVLIGITSVTAAAQTESDEQARAAFRLGRAHYDNGDFIKAAEQFEKSYRISKKPELLYNIYVSYRDANMSRQAAEALRGYLTDANDIPNRGQLKARLETLERAIRQEDARAASQPVPVTAPPPSQPGVPAQEPSRAEPQRSAQAAAEPTAEVQAERPTETAPEPEAESRPFTPFILMGVGGAMVISSIVTGVVATLASAKLEKECPSKKNCDPDLKSTKSRGQAMAVTTDILLFGGLVTAGVGVALLFLQNSWDSEPVYEPAPVALGCAPSGCYGSVRLAF
jgi:tetratricopeptide (TPR) repeat protein